MTEQHKQFSSRPQEQARPVNPQGFPPHQSTQAPAGRPRRRSGGCTGILLTILVIGLAGCLLVTAYFMAPLRTDVLVLGIDRVPEGTALGRSDTMILISANPPLPWVKMLSIPRDLWVTIPGVGENRINTAHFFAEAEEPGSGPAAAVETVEQNFGLSIPYYARLRFDAVLLIVDAMGGVDLNLPEDMGGLTAGQHHLDGAQALAFIRDRKGADDFFRMEHAQVMLQAMVSQMLSPASWPRVPAVIEAALSSVDTNLPTWQWPRVGAAFVRAIMTGGLDSRTIQREMTTPTITDGGANVLMPNWDLIRPFVDGMFPQ